jgi:glycosyltransferase involved in cell wall biosynthesis
MKQVTFESLTPDSKPLISIIMPVYNAEAYLNTAIKSIVWQTYKNWELILINDGSTDESATILTKWAKKDSRIRILSQDTNKGLAYTLNSGVAEAKGPMLARMDADDISLPRRLETQLNYLLSNKFLVAVGCQVELIDENGETIGSKQFPTKPEQLYDMMLEMMPIQHPALLTYTQAMKQCKYENHTTAEDVSMFFKLLRYGSFGNVPKTLFQYRIRLNSNSLIDPKKTYFLTLASRIKGVLEYGYRPNLKGILMNIAQLLVVLVLPKTLILKLYETFRFRTAPVSKVYKRTRVRKNFGV